jgi:hypothetical protein
MTLPKLTAQATMPQVVAAITAAAAQIQSQGHVSGVRQFSTQRDATAAIFAVITLFQPEVGAAGIAINALDTAFDSLRPQPSGDASWVTNGQPGNFWPQLIQVVNDSVGAFQSSSGGQHIYVTGTADQTHPN